MTKLSSSPDRNSFQRDSLMRQVEEGRTTAEHATEMVELFKTWDQLRQEKEQQPEWAVNNMEHDLRTTEWICAKAQASDVYAQNLYAAMCNRSFQKIDVWPMLKGETWSCSWRYAGGIVADMCGKGDYMDYYCSGIRGDLSEDDRGSMTAEDIQQYEYYSQHFVGESHVTDEIRADLRQLGWSVLDDDSE